MDKMAQISVVIVTWNAKRFAADCLESVFSQTAEGLEVIVVDNGSTDGTPELLKAYSSRIRLIENRENKGFCYANNQAIKIAKGRYALTLNSDMVLDKNYIFYLKEYLCENPKVGMVQGKFLRMDKSTIDGLGLRLSPLLRLFNIAEGKKDSPKFNNSFEIFGPCAAAAMYRKELMDDIKVGDEFFDDRFFFLVEDFDVAWRARKKGWKAMYVPGAVCYHYRQSSEHHSAFKQYLSFRNRYFMLIKNESPAAFILALPFLLCYDLPRFVFLLIKNPYLPKAISEIYSYLPELLQRRRGTKEENA
ncbi:MAG: glycosyltransferase family 2 protein [Candidatus Omnitrophica bacterium]|nr:glycosyltransferase family 2 protein [Candidatus Omnitrophota bacterium]MBU4478027.1 glycosyltransferase family 2 protein [Candidatus Omnitrophota bacterium]MCG2703635.1 glycosyltransferase family 2 protein [Candidatus Omnitrophota bacterium]